MSKNIDLANDKLVLGGHEFTSRFILGSGKFSLDLVKACIEKADAQIITLALRRANDEDWQTSSTIFRTMSHCFQTHQAPEMPMRL